MFERFPETSIRTLFIARSLAVLAGPQHLLLAVLRSNSHAAVLVRESGLDDRQLERDAVTAAAIDDKPLNYAARLEMGGERDAL